MRVPLASIVIAFVAGILLTSLEPADAQDPESSPNPAVYKAQLIQFIQLARKNLYEIQALPVDDSIPIDPAVRNNARNNYILIRAAVWGMDLQMQKANYRDPILVLAQKRVDEAKNLARYPVDFTGGPRGEYVNKSVECLSRSLKLVHQALLIMP